MILALVAAAALQLQTVLTIDPSHRLVEGVASDGRTIWVSSILDRTILACRRKTCRTLAVLPQGLHPFAIAYDRSRKRLWVAADCPPGVKGIVPCERGALLALDDRGRIRTRIAPFIGQFHPGDVSAADGQVFVSDSQNGMVFRLTSNDRAIMAVVLPGAGKSAQGTALDPTGKRLIVADYSKGIATVELATFARQLLPRENGRPLRGIDGLVRCGSTYYGVYNGAAPGALVAIMLTENGLRVTEPLANLPMPDPTQIAFDGKRLLVVPDSGWATLDKAGFVRTKGAEIVAIPLSRGCKPG